MARRMVLVKNSSAVTVTQRNAHKHAASSRRRLHVFEPGAFGHLAIDPYAAYRQLLILSEIAAYATERVLRIDRKFIRGQGKEFRRLARVSIRPQEVAVDVHGLKEQEPNMFELAVCRPGPAANRRSVRKLERKAHRSVA